MILFSLFVRISNVMARTPTPSPSTPFKTPWDTPDITPWRTPFWTPNATQKVPTLTPLIEYIRIEERKPENIGLYILYAAFTLSGAILIITVIYFAFIYKRPQRETSTSSSTSSSESVSVPEKAVSLQDFGKTITVDSEQVLSDDPFAEDFDSYPPFEVSEEYFLEMEKD